MKTSGRFVVLLALAASVLAVQSASATNSPDMRIDYSLNDTTSGRTHSDLAFWGNVAVAGDYDGFRVFNTGTHQELTHFLCRGPQTTSRCTTTAVSCSSSSRTTRRRSTAPRSAVRTGRATRRPAEKRASRASASST